MCTAAVSIIVVDAVEFRTFELVDFRDLTGNESSRDLSHRHVKGGWQDP
jgi:hypothetical protein